MRQTWRIIGAWNGGDGMNPVAMKRREMRLTQEEISVKTGIPLRTISRIENNEKQAMNGVDGLLVKHFRILASFFNCSIDELVNIGNPPSTPSPEGAKKTKPKPIMRNKHKAA